MLDQVNKPEDWGVASKDEWVADRPLDGEGVMPALEGRDVVGFVETVDFAVKLAPGKPAGVQQWTDEGGRPVKFNPSTKSWYHIDQSAKKDLQKKLGTQEQQGKRPAPKSEEKPRPKPAPKQEEKSVPPPAPAPAPKPKPPEPLKEEVSQKQQEPPPEKSQEQSTSQDPYAIDQSTSQSISRVKDLSSIPATDPAFRSGQVAFKQIDEHYSKQSSNDEALSRLSGKGGFGNKVMTALLKDFDLDQQVEIKKKTFVTPREVLQQAGLDVNNPERVKKFQSLLEGLNSHLGPDGNWKTSPVHSLSEGLGFFEAEHIQHRADMADSGTSPSDLRVKAFSVGADFDDSSSWADMSPGEIDLAFHLLPTGAQTALKKSGSPDKYYDPLSPGGQSKNPTDLRGRLALFMWAKQGGRDGYSLSGMQRSPGEFQVEHVQDLSSGGKDTASNFVMLLKRVNEPRSSLPLPTFVDQASRRAKEVQKNLADPSGEFLQTRLKALQQRGIHDSLSDSSSPLMGSLSSLSSPEFFRLIQRNSESLPENLRPSADDFNRFADSVNSITDPATKITDLNAPQMNQLLSSIEEFGADPDKVKEYVGRSVFNNYHDGNRIQSIKSDGTIVAGRGGTNGAPAPLQFLENRLLGRPESVTPEDYQAGLSSVSKAHDDIRNARNSLIEQGGGDFAEFHEALGQSLMTICGLSDSSPEWIKNRKINTRDLTRTIENYIGTFPPTRPVRGDLASLYVSAALDYNGVSKEQLDNPELIKRKAERTKVLKIKSVLDQITGSQS
jgi:hypothetical protein